MIFNQPLYGQIDYRSPYHNIYQPPPQQVNQSQGGGMPPFGLIQQFAGGGSGSGGGIGGLFGSAPASGGATAGASGTGGAGGGFGSVVSAAGPWAALAAAIVANENYQKNIGNRDSDSFTGETALSGRALYKDSKVWGGKADDVVPGLGSGVRAAGALSSPYDIVAGDGLSDFWKEAKRGGTIGSIFRELF